MARAMDGALVAAAADEACRAVLVKGEGDRAFCAGGDIQRIYDAGRAGDSYPRDFFHDEYRMNARIRHFAKPYIALMDGIVMGGGVGLSLHGGLRVVTERLMLAMPETGIGLFPDVGGGHALPRLPGEAGMFMALTGARIGHGDALALGIGDFHVPSERLDELEDALAGDAPADLAAARAVVGGFAEDPGRGRLDDARADIDRLFAGDTVEAIVAALEADGGEWAARQRDVIATKSPTSLKIAFRQLREGARARFQRGNANGVPHGARLHERPRRLRGRARRGDRQGPGARMVAGATGPGRGGRRRPLFRDAAAGRRSGAAGRPGGEDLRRGQS